MYKFSCWPKYPHPHVYVSSLINHMPLPSFPNLVLLGRWCWLDEGVSWVILELVG